MGARSPSPRRQFSARPVRKRRVSCSVGFTPPHNTLELFSLIPKHVREPADSSGGDVCEGADVADSSCSTSSSVGREACHRLSPSPSPCSLRGSDPVCEQLGSADSAPGIVRGELDQVPDRRFGLRGNLTHAPSPVPGLRDHRAAYPPADPAPLEDERPAVRGRELRMGARWHPPTRTQSGADRASVLVVRARRKPGVVGDSGRSSRGWSPPDALEKPQGRAGTSFFCRLAGALRERRGA